MVTAALVVIDVVECAVMVAPESTPFIKSFLYKTLGVEAPLLGAAARVKVDAVVVLFAELNKAEAFGAVLTRKIESLFKVTLVVPAVFAEAASLGVYVNPASSDLIDKVSSVTRR